MLQEWLSQDEAQPMKFGESLWTFCLKVFSRHSVVSLRLDSQASLASSPNWKWSMVCGPRLRHGNGVPTHGHTAG